MGSRERSLVGALVVVFGTLDKEVGGGSLWPVYKGDPTDRILVTKKYISNEDFLSRD